MLVLSCGGTRPEAVTEDSAWQASLSVSGGVAGVQRRIVADSSGDVSVGENHDGPVHTRQLADAPLRALRQQVSAFVDRQPQTEDAGGQAWPDTDRGCADCVNFQLTVSTKGRDKPVTATWNSITPAEQRPELGKLLLQYSEPPD